MLLTGRVTAEWSGKKLGHFSIFSYLCTSIYGVYVICAPRCMVCTLFVHLNVWCVRYLCTSMYGVYVICAPQCMVCTLFVHLDVWWVRYLCTSMYGVYVIL